MAKPKFIKVDIHLLEKYGVEEALLVCYLFNLSKVLRKDDHGYFAVETAYISRGLNIHRRTLLRVINSAVSHGLIRYRPGKNQNTKPKFKVF